MKRNKYMHHKGIIFMDGTSTTLGKAIACTEGFGGNNLKNGELIAKSLNYYTKLITNKKLKKGN